MAMKALIVAAFDDPAAIQVRDIEVPDNSNGVLIDVQAAGLGFPDALIARGGYQVRPALPFVPGMELSGIVREALANSPWRPGQRVVALTGVHGACAEVVSVSPGQVYPAPDDPEHWNNGALVVNYHSAYFALVRRAQLAVGEVVLVHGAGGGLGQAMIQVAKALGARVIAVASSPVRQRAAREAGADEVLSPGLDWVEAARTLTNGRGVDVLIDPVGGARFDQSVRAVAPEGRLVIVGFASGEIPQLRMNRLLLRNISVLGAAWREFVTDVNPGYGLFMARELNAMIGQARLAPRVGARIPLRDGADALRAITRNQIEGRVSIQIGPGA